MTNGQILNDIILARDGKEAVVILNEVPPERLSHPRTGERS